MVEEKGFEPPAPTTPNMTQSARSFSRSSGECYHQRICSSSIRQGDDTAVYTALTKRGATGFVARTERTWTSESEGYPWNNQIPRRAAKKR